MGISIFAWLSSQTPILALDCVSGQYGSRDDNQANMEMSIY
jgi:hypothetical protein